VQTDDFWQHAMYASAAYIRAAASQAGVPVCQACQDLDERPGHPAPAESAPGGVDCHGSDDGSDRLVMHAGTVCSFFRGWQVTDMW
jgi:hypothetical protein